MIFEVGLFLVIAAIAVVGWARLRRHGQSDIAAAGWHPTDESFRDPSSGTIMRVGSTRSTTPATTSPRPPAGPATEMR